jgi:nucleoside-diphosphate-sugar epimerase
MPDGAPTPESRGTIFLTGATGFIGARLLEQLVGDGWRVRVLVRGGPERSLNLPAAAERVSGSLGDSEALGQGLAGATAVINCAGSVRGNDYRAFQQVNVDGLNSLVRVMARQAAEVPLLHLSSLAATEPELSAYARSKRAGERVLESCPDLQWTVLRPPAVYGPGDTEMRGALAWARRGLVPVPGGDRGQRLSMLHVDDLVSAVTHWLDEPARFTHGIYELDDGKSDGYDWTEFAAAVCRRDPLYLPLPRTALLLVAGINEALGRLTGRPVMLSRGKVRELTHPRWVADSRAFVEACSWHPRISLARGVRGLFESQLDLSGTEHGA